jgi:propane monooxygenase small subunit
VSLSRSSPTRRQAPRTSRTRPSADFNYYTPAKRKQTRYEDVTVEVQPDPRHYLAQGWLYGFSDGRGGYPLDWTR